MKEPRVLRLTESSLVNTSVEHNGITYKFSKGVREVIVPDDFDTKKLNKQIFVLGNMRDDQALKWYRDNAKKSESKEIVKVEMPSHDEMAEILKANNYIVYKKKT